MRRTPGSQSRPPLAESDYIAHPRASGYRGLHLIVAYPDAARTNRRIEVQLRTRVMHDWAITVERLSGQLGRNLKGDGEHAVQQLMEVISRAMALEEAGQRVGGDLFAEIAAKRAVAEPYLGRTGR